MALAAMCRIDDQGRVAIPKVLREAFGWKEGDTLLLSVEDKVLMIAKEVKHES